MSAGLTTSSDEDQLLRAHWLTGHDPQPRKWAGSKAIKSRFHLRKYPEEHGTLLAGLVDYTEGLRAACVGYCDARAPDLPESFASITDTTQREEIRRWSAKLIGTNVVAPFLPMLIATRNRFAGDASKYLELVQLCEAFAFRVYRLLERRADAGQADLFRIGYQLQRGRLSFEDAMRDFRRTLLAYCPDRWFEDALRQDNFNWYDWSGLKYYLYEYEEHLARRKGAMPKIAWETVRRRERADTIEHVLPQTPTAEYWIERFGEAQRRACTHDLGNLSLTKDNASYGNKPFPEKKGAAGSEKPCYAESSFFMERELAILDDWTPREVIERRTQLTEWALER